MRAITRIPLKSMHNTRDLGGFESRDGRRIKEHRLLRSGQLNGISDLDMEVLTGVYDLKTIVDFRTRQERSGYPDPEIKGVNYIENPILSSQAVGITRESGSGSDMLRSMLKILETRQMQPVHPEEDYMEGLYRNLVMEEGSREGYRNFFRILLEQDHGAVLWHCSAGKDRVGVGTALLLSALSIPQETIFEDYLMVNIFAAESVEAQIAKAAGYVKNPEMLTVLRTMLRVKREYLEQVFRAAEEEFGSMDRFLTEVMELNEEKREHLKALYLE